MRRARLPTLGGILVLALECACSRSDKGSVVSAKPSASTLPVPAPRVVIPIHVRPKYANPNALAIAVPVRFTSPHDPARTRTLDLELDTGSSGVAVFASSLAGIPVERFGKALRKTYGGGDVFDEQLARVRMAFGDAVVPEPVVVRIVDRVSCAPERPSCNASTGDERYLTAQGFHGVLGTGMRIAPGQEALSPIPQLPGELGRAYVVRATAHELILGPSESDTSGYERIALSPSGAGAFDDRAIPVCISIEGSDVTGRCGAALIDSGSWSLVFGGLALAPSLRSGPFLAEGTRVSFGVSESVQWSWTAKHHQMHVPEQGLLGGFDRVLGMPFFHDFDVLFERREGRIGLRRSASDLP